MSSSTSSRVAPASAFSYAVSLRVRHPTLDLACLTETLRLEPAHSWIAGDPRRSQSGSLLGGQHRDSYWSALLPMQMVGASPMPLELFFNQQVVQLSRHRDILTRIQEDGGEVSMLIEMAPTPTASMTLSPATTRKLGEMNIEVEFQFSGD